MGDLIYRGDALKLLDMNGVVFRREFEELPAVDAIPVEWLESLRYGYSHAYCVEANVISLILWMWKNKQDR